MFRVFADAPSGRAVSPSNHETAHEAFAKVVDLMSHGMVRIRIMDDAGREFTPTEFAKETGEPQGKALYSGDFDDDRR